MVNGGHLPGSSITAPTVETGIQTPPFPAPEVSTTGTLTPQSQNEQPVQCSPVKNESDLESSSGLEAGPISAHESQVDTDVKSGGPQWKRPTLNIQYQAEDDRELPTMCAPKPAVHACHSDSGPRLDPPGSPLDEQYYVHQWLQRAQRVWETLAREGLPVRNSHSME
jgi:hypothetical protein